MARRTYGQVPPPPTYHPQPYQSQQAQAQAQAQAPPLPLNSWLPPSVANVTHEQSSSSAIEPLKKRKSSELTTDTDEEANLPPWRNGTPRNVLEDRVSFPPLPPDKRQRLDPTGKTASKSHANLESRKKRF